MPPGRALVLYHYFEKDDQYVDNFCHFMEFGYRRDIDIRVVVSGECLIDLPEAPNIQYHFTENRNNDFGGFCSAIAEGAVDAGRERYLFINSSVRGPFLPPPVAPRTWLERLASPLSAEVGLCGSAINILDAQAVYSRLYERLFGGRTPFSHVQTTAYAMTGEVFRHLLSTGLFGPAQEMDKEEVISRYELRLSQLVLAMGLDLKCQLPEYNRIDYRQPHGDINPTSVHGDPSHRNAYFGRTLHPYEGMFTKTNRGLFTEGYLDRLAASMRSGSGTDGASLQGAELQRYRDRLDRVATAREAAAAEVMAFTPGQVIELARQLAREHPQYRAALGEALAG